MEKIFEVEIFGEKYKLKSNEKEEYIQNLSSFVDKKMREIEAELKISDPLKIAVLAALSIADEKFSCEVQLSQFLEAIKKMEDSVESLEVSILKNHNKLNFVNDVT
jgi:cell division protein ZapA (FtsZ GTPase activity inhibitor)